MAHHTSCSFVAQTPIWEWSRYVMGVCCAGPGDRFGVYVNQTASVSTKQPSIFFRVHTNVHSVETTSPQVFIDVLWDCAYLLWKCCRVLLFYCTGLHFQSAKNTGNLLIISQCDLVWNFSSTMCVIRSWLLKNCFNEAIHQVFSLHCWGHFSNVTIALYHFFHFAQCLCTTKMSPYSCM